MAVNTQSHSAVPDHQIHNTSRSLDKSNKSLSTVALDSIRSSGLHPLIVNPISDYFNA